MQSPYATLIQTYFPPEEWENADCIQMHECPPTNLNWPFCVSNTDDHGLFQINAPTWNPDRNPRSPFTRDQWANVMDPNVNVWMASVIWHQGGWSQWATAHICGLTSTHGGTIPYPDGPVGIGVTDCENCGGGGEALMFGAGLAAITAAVVMVGRSLTTE